MSRASCEVPYSFTDIVHSPKDGFKIPLDISIHATERNQNDKDKHVTTQEGHDKGRSTRTDGSAATRPSLHLGTSKGQRERRLLRTLPIKCPVQCSLRRCFTSETTPALFHNEPRNTVVLQTSLPSNMPFDTVFGDHDKQEKNMVNTQPH